MKIEKINENQIRCTLTEQDLASRQLKLSELAYGTEQAKILFHDMIEQANYELGFDAGDIPLMIEAIPISPKKLILLITKVESPEELDTRFAKFSDMSDALDEISDEEFQERFSDSADDIISLFKKIAKETGEIPADAAQSEDFENSTLTKTAKSKGTSTKSLDVEKIFRFQNLAEIKRVAHVLKKIYKGRNSLYKDEKTHTYYLVIHKTHLLPETFNKVCNILAEYGHQVPVSTGMEAFYKEHYTIICKQGALDTLVKL